MQFYPSGNTSLFNVNERPLVNNSVDDILEQLEGDDIVERLKRPNSNKSIVSFESVASNMCFWFCLARHKYQDVRLDRLSTKSKELYKNYYKVKPDKSYPGVDIQELDSIEDHFSVNINIYRFNGKKAVMERHSRKNCDSTVFERLH
ncbi:hypothetical protein BDEG_23575 [Batrachochytrium dendrobatidis JEL423]|uniref:Uncharacterized protein n=1 Tax=Batrachochytrium dendrobatidis (strain JEL423) TaxID=403673 RepID=A0A177WI08_BATDL|nr:hypothetical protein BDEG_23575 [Batrachochytrium dendrobatidis JEL423]